MRYDQFSTCERLFLEGESFFHLCTKPIEIDILFRSPEELNEALNMVAMAVFAADCRLLAFAIMSNHLHFVIEGSLSSCEAFFGQFHALLSKFLSRTNRFDLSKQCIPNYVPINNLKQLRDEIAYVVRNPYVASPNVNMFSYRWCSGYLLFNDMLEYAREGEYAINKTTTWRRSFTRSRNGEVSPRLIVLDGVALPSCFVDFKRAESFFSNAREYQQWLLKNVESQVAVAKRLGDTIVLNDNEMWEVACRQGRELFKVNNPRELSADNRIILAKTLKYDYNATNSQISRCLGIIRSAVDQIFPLSNK